MKTRTVTAGMTIIAMLLVSSLAFAGWRGYRGSGGWGPGGAYQRMYDPKTVETIKGTVESVEKTIPMKGMNYGIHVMLKADKETIAVHLGPQWYIERQDVKIVKGDAIEVKGSRITFDKKPAIVAAEVKKGDQTLILRDANGIPAWAGWRR